MTLTDFHSLLIARDAFIVHCSRPGRGGEFGPPKPYYPDDLRAAINDLTSQAGRNVCCSVVWPANQHTFGAVGVVIRARAMSDITGVCPIDAGTPPSGQGFGVPLSEQSIVDTFASTETYNEWVLIGGDVVGLYVSATQPFQVAREMLAPEGISEAEASLQGYPRYEPADITPEELRTDFPDLPVFTFHEGRLIKFDFGKPPTEEHPY